MAENDFVPNLGAPTSPEAELDKLLATSGAGGVLSSPAVKPASLGIPKPANLSRLLIYIGIGLLALAVVGGTIWLVVSLLLGAKGEVTFELNESQVQLAVDGKSYGQISAGDKVKLKAGDRALTLSKPGFLTIEEILKIEGNTKRTLVYELLPVPQISKLAEGSFQFARLNSSGSEVSYWDFAERVFKTITLASGEVSTLFSGGVFDGVRDVIWSPTTQAAIVKIEGRPSLARTIDNREVTGRYIPFGESPSQGPAKFNGFSNWLLDDNLKPASGWTPVALTDNLREVTFSGDGGEIIYLYEAANGEYSLIRGLPDGREWERVIVEMPRMDGAKLSWDASSRYLLADTGKLSLIDVVSKTVQEMFPDRVAESTYAFSPDGNKIAYIANAGDGVRVAVYDLLTQQVNVLKDIEVTDETLFTWMDSSDLMLAMPNQSFMRVDTVRGKKTIIPFTGEDTNFQIRALQYSKEGHVLMLTTDKGLFTMKI